VEFALVLPMLLILLLGIADFGRVFSAGITMEAAARNAAEAAAQEYVQLVRNKAGGALDTADYQHLHQVALDAVCKEAKVLPNHAMSGGSCTMPVAAVCVHDGNDMYGCGAEADPSASTCGAVNDSSTWEDDNMGTDPDGAGPLTALPYVEVRTCYQFTTLFNLSDVQLPLGWSISVGQIFLERDRTFTVAIY
jgi:hypothetical protein